MLLVNGVGFRIHHGLLARRSSVFKDLFEIKQPAGTEKVEGCPFVHLSDSPEDIEKVLDIVYSGMR